MRIGIAQLNPHVGHIEKNCALVMEYLEAGEHKHRLDLVVFPELMLTGYPPEDLLYRPALHVQVGDALAAVTARTGRGNTGVIVGYPRKSGNDLYNSCACLRHGKILAGYDKIELPNYGVFDEKRYFKTGTRPCVVDIEGIPVALSICEDIWAPGPVRLASRAGAKLLININASPFHELKVRERRAVLQARNRETGLPVIYVNQVGGQDELVFDGGSLVMDAAGEIIFSAPEFEEGLFTVEAGTGEDGSLVLNAPHASHPAPSQAESLYRALVLAIRDYVYKNGFNGVVIGLSGGIDSALVSCLATDALGPENVEVLLMPSRYTARISIEDATGLAENLGIAHHEISIEPPFSAFTGILEPLFTGLPEDSTEENIQSRCRGVILMAVSNKTGKLVLTTGNKSEMAVGYATLYGDMAGGFAPLKDLSKKLVYRLARWRNSRSPVIPRRIIDRPPTAELRPDQKDEDSLPSYDVLDAILERYIEQDQSPQEIINAGFDAEDVRKVARLVDQNEYKRRQAAPGVKISKRAFGRERRYPITSGYREQ